MRHTQLCAICSAILIALSLATPVAAAKRIALVIGNSDYKETAPLANTTQDANDLAAALKRLGFEVLPGIDLDKRAMERLIRQFDVMLSGAEIALFFYAGHAIQVSGQNYLIPIDARLAAEGDIDFESLPLSIVLSRMEREAKTSLVLLDACRDNPLARKLSRSMGSRSVGIGQGLSEVRTTGVGTLIGFSTQPGNVALDGKGRNSPYTTALLKQIESPGRDILAMLADVRGEVYRETDGKQVPWEHTSLMGPVVLKTPLEVKPLPSPPPPTPQWTEAERAWPEIKTTTNIPTLEAFIRRFPDTFFGDLAKARLAELKAAASKVAPAPAPAPVTTGAISPPEAREIPKPAAPAAKIAHVELPAPTPIAAPAPKNALAAPSPAPAPKIAPVVPPPTAAPKVALAVPPPLPVPPATPALDPAEQVRAIQDALRKVGCFTGTSTGTWSPPTAAAVARFNERSSHKIAADGPSAEAVTLLGKLTAQICPPPPRPSPARTAPIQGIQ